MHNIPTKLKMKSACSLHKGSVTFVMLHLYIINLTRKKKPESSFSAVRHDIIFVKEAEWKPRDVKHHYIRENCGVENYWCKFRVNRTLWTTKKSTCMQIIICISLFLNEDETYSSLFIYQLAVQLNTNHNPQIFRLRSVEYLTTNVYPITLSRTSQKTKKPYCYSMRCKLVTGYSTVRLFWQTNMKIASSLPV